MIFSTLKTIFINFFCFIGYLTICICEVVIFFGIQYLILFTNVSICNLNDYLYSLRMLTVELLIYLLTSSEQKIKIVTSTKWMIPYETKVTTEIYYKYRYKECFYILAMCVFMILVYIKRRRVSTFLSSIYEQRAQIENRERKEHRLNG